MTNNGFQSAPPHGGRLDGLSCVFGSCGKCFNPRPRTGGDTIECAASTGHRLSFNPRPRTGGDTTVSAQSSTPWLVFQSAPPHGGRLETCCESWHPPHVSIRAPARGATHNNHFFNERVIVSIRAPARGATDRRREYKREESTTVFQSAPPHGGRPSAIWRARATCDSDRFQSAPPHGGRHYVFRAGLTGGGCGTVFQSAPPHGGRPGGPQMVDGHG